MSDLHGIDWRYGDGCRCLACADAWAVYTKQLRHRRESLVAANGLPETVEHGLAGYVNWGCRCSVCTEAKRARNAADRARRKKANR